MQEEFEKKLREQMHAFGIQPAPQVWDDIDAALSKKKRRRFFIGWWLLPGLIAGIGLFFLIEKNNKPTTAKNNIQQAVAKDTTQKGSTATESTAGTNNAKTTPAPAENKIQNNTANTPIATKTLANPSITGKHSIVALTASATVKQNNPGTITQPQPDEIKTAATQSNSPTPVATPQTNAITLQPKGGVATIVPAAKVPVTSSTANSGDTANVQPVPPTTNKAQPITKNTSEEKPTKISTAKLIKPHPHQLFITLSSGVLQTPNRGPFITPGNSYIANYYMPLTAVLPLSTLAAFKQLINKPSAGWYASAGGSYQYSLSNRWRLNAGLQLMYLSNTQKAGNYFGAQLTSPSVALYSLGGQSYFLPGSKNGAVNKSWQLQVPVSLSYVLNPHAKTKFSIDGGLSYSWQYSSLWLIPDAHYSRLYYNKSLVNNSIYSWQFGPSMQLHNQLKFGLQFSRSFNPIAESYITPKLYWQRIGVQASIPLTFKKEKHANK